MLEIGLGGPDIDAREIGEVLMQGGRMETLIGWEE